MKVAAEVSEGALRQRFARLQTELEEAALDAAADALASELVQAREREGLHAPLARDAAARSRTVGTDDPESIARELSSPGRFPAPWLAPVLPAARAPMRAAASARVRDVVAAHAGNHTSAVARALSRFKR